MELVDKESGSNFRHQFNKQVLFYFEVFFHKMNCAEM